MSRRSRYGQRSPSPQAAPGRRPAVSIEPASRPVVPAEGLPAAAAMDQVLAAPAPPVAHAPVVDRASSLPEMRAPTVGGAPAPSDRASDPPAPVADPARGPEGPRTTCTAAQLRRFIKSRPWIPMHELRRRFGISGADDDVTPVRVAGTMIYVGLPAAEGRLVGDLLASGDVGYELSLDPDAPIVVGVYPLRPVPRG